jgi:hypothetical protein
MGIRDKPIAPRSAWQNGVAERLIGSIRRERTDHIIVFGEAHLRRVLKSYATYYNAASTHRSSNKDSPISRPVHRTGRIILHPVLPWRIAPPILPNLSFAIHNGREIHGQEKAVTFARLEDLPSQSRRRNRIDTYVRRPNDFVSAIVGFLVLRHSRRELLWLGGDCACECRMGCPSTNRSLRLERTATIYHS